MPDDGAHAGDTPAATSILEGLPPYPVPNASALEPPPEWERLRSQCPVARIELASGDEALRLTRDDDVPRVSDSEDGEVLSRHPAVAGEAAETDEPEASILGAPGHQRWRRLVGKALTVKRVQALPPGMTQLAEQLLADMIESGATA